MLQSHQFHTPLGNMLAIADKASLFLLEFTDAKGLTLEINRLEKMIGSKIPEGSNDIMLMIEEELGRYFRGQLQVFKTPISFGGTLFQKDVWKELQKILYGHTRSYTELAHLTGRPAAFRAAANANASNQLAIIIPCHRVINRSGALGGYAGGVWRKKFLLELEGGLRDVRA